MVNVSGRRAVRITLGTYHISCKITSELHRADFRSVHRCESLEDTPRDTQQDLASQQGLYVLGEERYEDESRQRYQRSEHRDSVAIFFGDDTVEEQADDLSNSSTVGQSRLPGCRDRI